MKFILIMTMCSSIYQNCTNPLKIGEFPSFYECSLHGYEKATHLIKELGFEKIEKNQMMISFYCKSKVVI